MSRITSRREEMPTATGDRGTICATEMPQRDGNRLGPTPKIGASMPPQNTATAPRVEKAPARGQRISRQPWKAWNRHGCYLGVFATKQEAELASQADDRPSAARMA